MYHIISMHQNHVATINEPFRIGSLTCLKSESDLYFKVTDIYTNLSPKHIWTVGLPGTSRSAAICICTSI